MPGKRLLPTSMPTVPQKAATTSQNPLPLVPASPNRWLLSCAGTQVPQPSSPAAVIVPDLIDSALQMYGVPASAVTRTAGVCRSFWHAPCFAQKLHEGSEGGAVVMLIGDAAMQVRAINGVSSHVSFWADLLWLQF